MNGAIVAVLNEKSTPRLLQVLALVVKLAEDPDTDPVADVEPISLLCVAQQLCADLRVEKSEVEGGLSARLGMLKFVVTSLLDRLEEREEEGVPVDIFFEHATDVVAFISSVLEETEGTINKSDPSTRTARTDLKVLKAMVTSINQ